MPAVAVALVSAAGAATADDAPAAAVVAADATDATTPVTDPVGLSPDAPNATAPTPETEIPAADASAPEVLPLTTRSAPSDSVIRLSFGGDVHFEDKVRRQSGASGLRAVGGLFRNSDIAMVNLETALTSRGKPISKEFSFRAGTRVLRTLKSRGVDVVTMANNHSIDYGTRGLADTLRAKATSPLPIVGLGRNIDDAIKPWVKDVRGTTFAYFGAMNSEPLSDEKNPPRLTQIWTAGPSKAGVVTTPAREGALLASIADWSKKVDVVVVDMHWGIEGNACPSGRQTSMMSRLRAAGADVIVGSHPHVLQGAGFAGSAAVGYSMGNFVWYNQFSKYSAVLNVDIVNGKPARMSYQPVKIGGDGQPHAVGGAGARWVKARMASGARCAGLTSSPRG